MALTEGDIVSGDGCTLDTSILKGNVQMERARKIK